MKLQCTETNLTMSPGFLNGALRRPHWYGRMLCSLFSFQVVLCDSLSRPHVRSKQNRRGNYLRELFPLSPSNLSAASCRLWMIEAMPNVSASTGTCAQACSWSDAFYVVMNKLCAGIKHYYINMDKLLGFERRDDMGKHTIINISELNRESIQTLCWWRWFLRMMHF